jgi:cell surface hyaluronidase
MNQKFPIPQIISEKTLKKEFLLLYSSFFTLLLVAFLFIKHANTSPKESINSYSNNKNNYYLSNAAFCAPLPPSMAKIQSVPHVGTVVKPVGSAISGLKKWSDVNTWVSKLKPAVGDDVLIPANSVVVLDQDITVKSIRVEGKLIIDVTKDIKITAEYIIVNGASGYFEWGTPTVVYNKKGSITLVGNDATVKIPDTDIESKGIVVMNDAVIEMHGKQKTSWTNLQATAIKGATTITIATNTNNWEVGDEILIAPTRLSPDEGEQRTITGISADKKTLTLNSPLNFPHSGLKKSYTRKTDGKAWELDMRAEVGLLSKSIKIQGDNNSDANGFGGHIMIHSTGIAHIENIELFQMGQKGLLGRYPFHWHLLEERGKGQYLKNTSIHKTYNRAITIHATESVLVENNFCYNHLGHGLFLEEGSERFNIIRNNVVLLTKRPEKGDELTPSDNEANEVQNRTPSSYWITNPNNIFENNVAAGTQGTGFWYALPKKPMGTSLGIPRFADLEPFKDAFGKFSGNKAHSSRSGFDIFDQLTEKHALIRNGAWQRTDTRFMDNCTWYACDLAVYGGIGGGRTLTDKVVFRNNVFSDNRTSVMHANYSIMDESLFVANSGEDVFVGERMLNRGYDGACTIKNSHMVGWQASNANYVQNTGGALKHVNYRVSGMTSEPAGPPRMSFPDYSKAPKGEVGANDAEHPRFWSYIHWDMDGSLGGKKNTSIVTNHPLCRDGSEVRYENWTNLYRTDRRFAFFSIAYPNPTVEEPKLTVVRTKAGTPKAGMYYINGFFGQSTQFPVMVNDGFLYTIQYESLNPSKFFTLRIQDDYVAGDEVLMRIKDFGKLPGITIDGKTKYDNLTLLKAAKSSGYTIDSGYLYIKSVAIAGTPDQGFRISWTSNITLPKLDTDGDGISDKDESIAGTDPIPNDPIKVNPVIKFGTTLSTVREQQLLSQKITVFPNPSVDGNFKINESLPWEVYSLQGSIIAKGISDVIDLSGKPKGIYILRVREQKFKLSIN